MSSTLPSPPVSWQKRLARLYARHRLQRAFADIRLLGISSLQDAMKRGPLLVASNHVAYWDAFLLVALEAHLKAHAHCLMDATNLKQFAFFRQLGALPLERSNPKQGLRDMRHSLSTLRSPGDLLFIFPSGQQQPAHWPLNFQPGIAYLAESSGLPVVPLGLRYDYREGPRPVIHLAFGEPLAFEKRKGRKQFTHTVQGAVTTCLNDVDQSLHLAIPQGESLLGHTQRIDENERRPALAQALNFLSGGQR